MVKNGKYVELSGRCDVANHEETKGSWIDKGEKRTAARTGLLGLIDALMNWFGTDPPVYSKAAAPSNPNPSSSPTPPARPASQNNTGAPPPTYTPPAPVPPRPWAVWTPQPPPVPNSHPVDPIRSAPAPAPWTPAPPSHAVSPPAPSPWTPAPPSHTASPPAAPAPWTAAPPSHAASPPPAPPRIQSAPPPIPAPNLLDSDDSASAGPAPAPPLPPNPILLSLHSSVHAKITSALQSLQTSLHHSSEHLRKIQEDLLRGEPAIQDEIARLEAVKAVSLNVGGRLRQSVDAAERNIQVLRDKGDVSVDELICGPTIVHNQLVPNNFRSPLQPTNYH